MTQESARTEAAYIDLIQEWLQGYNRDGNYCYFDLIYQMVGKTRLYVSFPDLDDELAKAARNHPIELVPAFKKAIYNILKDIHPDYADMVKEMLRVSFTGLDPEQANRLQIDMRGKLVCIVGKVRGIGVVQQVHLKTVYNCRNCGNPCTSEGTARLSKCPSCSEKGTLEENQEESVLEDQRFDEVTLLRWNNEDKRYEEPENAPELLLDLRADLVDSHIHFDDELLITGIVRTSETQGAKPIKEFSTSFLYIEVNNITQITREEESITLDPGDIKRLEAWRDEEQENLMVSLVASYAPRIYGYPELKELLLYQAVGSEVSNAEERDSINLLEIGDTSVAKTELAKYQAKITGGIYQSGEGLSGPGITVALEKDEKTGQYLKRAGLAVRGNGKVKCLDEIDKMPKEFLKQLSTVMESQEYYLSKVKHAKYATKGPWFCTGNPVYGNYDPYRNVTENLNFPSWVLSRFDFVIVIRDQYDKDTTDKVLEKIDARFDKQQEMPADILDTADVRKFIKLAKQKTNIAFDKDALIGLRSYFHILKNTEDMVITYRQYLGLKRTAIARAKLHLRENVTKDDVERAIYLMNYTLKTVGIDVTTGHPDLGVLYGKPQSQMNELKKFMDAFNRITGGDHKEVSKEMLITTLVETDGFSPDNVLRCITKAEREGLVYQRSPGVYVRS